MNLSATGEHVADICADCLCDLPLGWGGDLIELHACERAEPVAYIPC